MLTTSEYFSLLRYNMKHARLIYLVQDIGKPTQVGNDISQMYPIKMQKLEKS